MRTFQEGRNGSQFTGNLLLWDSVRSVSVSRRVSPFSLLTQYEYSKYLTCASLVSSAAPKIGAISPRHFRFFALRTNLRTVLALVFERVYHLVPDKAPSDWGTNPDIGAPLSASS
jgi:hypothetical protein